MAEGVEQTPRRNEDLTNDSQSINMDLDDQTLLDQLMDDSQDTDSNADMHYDFDFSEEDGDRDEPYFPYFAEQDSDRVQANPIGQTYVVTCNADIYNLELPTITEDEVRNLKFANLDLAYTFYNEYGKYKGFSARKSKLRRNNDGDVLQQIYVCHKQGFRDDKYYELEERRRTPRKVSRCGCGASIRVHVDKESGLWFVRSFVVEHNHELVDTYHSGMMAGHRKMRAGDVLQINSMRHSGISNPQMFTAIAGQSGGYERVPFRKKDIDNQFARQRMLEPSDAAAAVKYLEGLRSDDPMMIVRHTADKEKRLEHLFWSDGVSQVNYELFGDVLAFDATYRKNKYEMPFVIFSGVNHHNMTTVFACAFVANETEDTYVWLLRTFYDVMKGKPPLSVITDGCGAMRNAVKVVFPNAHHRLCAWHLIRNAVDNVKTPGFVTDFKYCMLFDLEAAEFHTKWKDIVAKYELGGNNRIAETYKKRKMWATSLIRGNFFGGIRTTSRCEALHSQMLKFVHARINLADFVRRFQLYLEYMRYREVEEDYETSPARGQEVLQTCLVGIEKSALQHFTSRIMVLIRRVLVKSLVMHVSECKNLTTYSIYTVSRYPKHKRDWFVSFYPEEEILKCSCQRMESHGLPCEHVIAVLVELRFDELPKSLILNRWTKSAKDSIRGRFKDNPHYWNAGFMCRYSCLLELCREVCNLGCKEVEEFKILRELFTTTIKSLKKKYGSKTDLEEIANHPLYAFLKDPPEAKSKGSRKGSKNRLSKSSRKNRCGACGQYGHNRKTCTPGVVDPIPTTNVIPPPIEEEEQGYVDRNDEVEDFDEYLMSQFVCEDSESDQDKFE